MTLTFKKAHTKAHREFGPNYSVAVIRKRLGSHTKMIVEMAGPWPEYISSAMIVPQASLLQKRVVGAGPTWDLAFGTAHMQLEKEKKHLFQLNFISVKALEDCAETFADFHHEHRPGVSNYAEAVYYDQQARDSGWYEQAAEYDEMMKSQDPEQYELNRRVLPLDERISAIMITDLQAICIDGDHDWVDEGYAGPDSGCIDMRCKRCGHSVHHTLY